MLLKLVVVSVPSSTHTVLCTGAGGAVLLAFLPHALAAEVNPHPLYIPLQPLDKHVKRV